MKKIFNVNGTEYTVENVTAIPYCGEFNEEERENALLVVSTNDSGEKFEFVVFGFDMPEGNDEFLYMCSDPYAWESDWEVINSVRK